MSTQQPNDLQSQSNAPVVEAKNTNNMTVPAPADVQNFQAHKVDRQDESADFSTEQFKNAPGPRGVSRVLLLLNVSPLGCESLTLELSCAHYTHHSHRCVHRTHTEI